ncbi:DNA adenine methylase [Vibrio crassostreae]|uniref:DNA adenine methylase n=1 Tax=Vibrio crassostreae TaxID=246167 RepID=UPI001B316246|nr:Dam family site-specific DNA-(adenine-N6)-methyltransferase [Vibrio crassostreae]
MLPFLKWAGGKRWIAPFVDDLYRELQLKSVVEPFCGAGAVSLHIEPEFAILNDNNKHLINLYKWVRSTGLHLTIDTTNSFENYIRNRDQFNRLIESGRWNEHQAAELFYYLNRTCFNGLCRFNQGKGHFNVGYGKYKKPYIAKNLVEYKELLGDIEITSESFVDIIKRYVDDALVFIDPPYYKTFTGYSETPFTLDDQRVLAKASGECTSPVVATNSFEPEIVNMYKENGFDVFYYLARRTIACDGQRQRVREMVAFKNIPLNIVKEKAKLNKIELYPA